MVDKFCNRCDKKLEGSEAKKIYYDYYCKDCASNPNPTFLLAIIYILSVLGGTSSKTFLMSVAFFVITIFVNPMVSKTILVFPFWIVMFANIILMSFMISMRILKRSIIFVFNLKIKN